MLLILAGVAISLTVNSEGLIGKAKNAVGEWNNRTKEEKNSIENLLGYLGVEPEEQLEEYDGTANAPEIKTGMIPVYYDNGWKKANKTKNNWYSYDTENKKWANVVTVKESGTKTRQTYMNAAEGEAIAEDDILAMFVWIPRYAYKIKKGYHTLEEDGTGEIDIKFLSKKTDKYDEGTALRQSNTNGEQYVVHPAFTEGNIGEEITGIWVGKFESSNYTSPKDNVGNTASNGRGDMENVTIKPNVNSWRYTIITEMYEVCKAMNDTGNNIHGLTEESDTMMMKNSQWGAVAYLAQSDYGNKQIATDNTSGIWNNSYAEENLRLTGMTALEGRDDGTDSYRPVSNKEINNDYIVITYVGNLVKTFYRYNTEIGQRGSTTGNIYGIYDMSGGAWEYMASFLENGTNDYATELKNKGEANYVDRYAEDSYDTNFGIYGDAVYETSAYTRDE